MTQKKPPTKQRVKRLLKRDTPVALIFVAIGIVLQWFLKIL